MPSTPLLDLITAAELRRLAGPGAYLRGEAYAAIRRVHSLFEDGSHVTAAVRGTEEYQVHLSVASGALQHQCTCPAAAEGAFCKHCVAVAIALREGGAKGVTAAVRPVSAAELRAFLAGQTHEWLVELLTEHAPNDPRLLTRLTLELASRSTGPGGGPDVARIRAAIDEAVAEGDEYDGVSLTDVLVRLGDVHRALENLLATGHVSALVELSEYAILAAHDYSDVLGPEGLAEYRRLAQSELDALPAQAPAKRGRAAAADARRDRLLAILSSLSRLDGDVDAQGEPPLAM